ncbi:GNAT family N-acetyltransferase [Rhodopseudomonas sp. P2A-2r]|uniref:GNAT family N-acetyltransferase n=1 Tax=Rhodopseudomonas sp. P2A-2r TaxID=2991972 RepID=UPI0022345886|nr:GNAT family N-acetyltransferase [Rhodopseudomonas sp. P2A-2r]UZE48663.1 GNAT family N-acetyltransferase [Rhodopseudomonas sp. P2A-2r]
MLALDLNHLDQYSDHLRSLSGVPVTVRFVAPEDASALQAYFRSLSVQSRYNRLMGAASELPPAQLDAFTHLHDDGRFSVVATVASDAMETIVGEARYAFDEDTASVELGLSVANAFQGQGIGTALMANLECRAAALCAKRLFGDTLRTNDAMVALARKSGFAFAAIPNDWRQVRFTKPIEVAPREVPCATWHLLAEAA